MAQLKKGDRVRFKDRSDCFPDSYPLAGAEGEVIVLYPWTDCFSDFQEYVAVRIDKSDGALGIGSRLIFRKENLEPV